LHQLAKMVELRKRKAPPAPVAPPTKKTKDSKPAPAKKDAKPAPKKATKETNGAAKKGKAQPKKTADEEKEPEVVADEAKPDEPMADTGEPVKPAEEAKPAEDEKSVEEEKPTEEAKPAPAKKSGPPAKGDKLDVASLPDVETHDAEKVTISSLLADSKAGIVLFTYPKASTPGCTFHCPLPYPSNPVRHQASLHVPRWLRDPHQDRPRDLCA